MTPWGNLKPERSVIRVGDGRGFAVSDPTSPVGNVIVTAAHCLPLVQLNDKRFVLTLPAHRASHSYERTSTKLLGALDSEATISAECFFADPIADVALLCEPDSQADSDDWERWLEFTDPIEPLKFGSAVPNSCAWILDLSGSWREVIGFGLSNNSIADIHASFNLQGGMSGSPILESSGRIVGLVSTDSSHPRLPHTLPAWFAHLILGGER